MLSHSTLVLSRHLRTTLSESDSSGLLTFVNRAWRLVKFAAPLVLAAGLPVVRAQTSPPPPAAYQDMYNSLATYLQSFTTAVNTGWDGTKSPVLFSGQLGSASSNMGPLLMNANYYSMVVLPEVNQLKALGAKAAFLVINYPVLDPNFHPSGFPDYQSLLNFYRQLGNDVRAAGLKLIVSNGATFSEGGPTWDVRTFYGSMTLDQYQAARTQQAVTIATQVKPDYMTVFGEPDTEANQTGFTTLNSTAGASAEISMIMAGLKQAGVTGIQLGAGLGSWTAPYKPWIQAYANVGVDYIDIHVFPVNKICLSQVPAMADYAASLGKPIASTQSWLNKETDTELGKISFNSLFSRNAFSFWQPLDLIFVQDMVNFSHWKHAVFFVPFWSQMFHTYLNYDATSSLTAEQLLGLMYKAAYQNVQVGQYTALGIAYGGMITNPPDTAAPSVPAGFNTVYSSTQVYITWPPSTDNVGVAGYVVYKDGNPITTVGIASYYEPGLTPSSVHTYAFAAYDGALNTSAKSDTITVTLRKQ